jgi:hypothetical protein
MYEGMSRHQLSLVAGAKRARAGHRYTPAPPSEPTSEPPRIEPRGMAEDMRMHEALVCTLLVQEGVALRLPLADIVDCGSRLELCIRPIPTRDALELAVRLVARLAAGGKRA